MGLVVSMCFLFLSFAKPLPGLSAQRPYTTILCPYFLVSVLAQFAVHLTVLVACVSDAHAHMPAGTPKPDPDGDFSANVVNTVAFLINLHITATTFAVNYVGRPFTTPLLQVPAPSLPLRNPHRLYHCVSLTVPPSVSPSPSLPQTVPRPSPSPCLAPPRRTSRSRARWPRSSSWWASCCAAAATRWASC
jgi:magnesium-transporting ATPase (P-type)